MKVAILKALIGILINTFLPQDFQLTAVMHKNMGMGMKNGIIIQIGSGEDFGYSILRLQINYLNIP